MRGSLELESTFVCKLRSLVVNILCSCAGLLGDRERGAWDLYTGNACSR